MPMLIVTVSCTVPTITGERGNFFAQVVRALHRSTQFTRGQHQQELFASVAANAVISAQVGLQPARNLAQSFVAKQMAQRIIHFFEVIDVGENYAQGLLFAAGPFQFALQHAENFGMIQQARQRIARRRLAHRLARRDQFVLQIKNAFAS